MRHPVTFQLTTIANYATNNHRNGVTDMNATDIIDNAIETLKAKGATVSVKVVDYATNIPARRDMISAAFRIHRAKDPIATMKKFEKKYGRIIRDAHGAAYEIGYYRNDCIAVCHQQVDAILSDKFGWPRDY